MYITQRAFSAPIALCLLLQMYFYEYFFPQMGHGSIMFLNLTATRRVGLAVERFPAVRLPVPRSTMLTRLASTCVRSTHLRSVAAPQCARLQTPLKPAGGRSLLHVFESAVSSYKLQAFGAQVHVRFLKWAKPKVVREISPRKLYWRPKIDRKDEPSSSANKADLFATVCGYLPLLLRLLVIQEQLDPTRKKSGSNCRRSTRRRS